MHLLLLHSLAIAEKDNKTRGHILQQYLDEVTLDLREGF